MATKDPKLKVTPRTVVRARYRLTLTLTEDMLGTVPYDQNIYETFIETKKPKNIKDKESKTVPKPGDEEKGRGRTGFHRDPKQGLFLYNYVIKGFFKNAANVLKGEERGHKSLVNDHLFVFPRRLYLKVKKHHGVFPRPLRAQTMQGPRVTVVQSDFVKAGTKIECELVVADSWLIKETMLEKWLEYGELMGLGQFRNGSFGTFTSALTKVK